MKKIAIVIICAVLLNLLFGCSNELTGIRDEIYNAGLEAINIADQFLDTKITAKEASSVIWDLGIKYLDKRSEYSKYSVEELEIASIILDLSLSFSYSPLASNSKEDYEKVLESRNTLAELIEQNIRKETQSWEEYYTESDYTKYTIPVSENDLNGTSLSITDIVDNTLEEKSFKNNIYTTESYEEVKLNISKNWVKKDIDDKTYYYFNEYDSAEGMIMLSNIVYENHEVFNIAMITNYYAKFFDLIIESQLDNSDNSKEIAHKYYNDRDNDYRGFYFEYSCEIEGDHYIITQLSKVFPFEHKVVSINIIFGESFYEDNKYIIQKVLEPSNYLNLKEEDEYQESEWVYNSPKISLSEFNKLKIGMTYYEAVDIIGGRGTQTAVSEMSGIRVEMYSWEGENGSGAASVMFTNGKLSSKSQVGLK